MIEFKNARLHYHYDDYAVLKDVSCTFDVGVNTVLCDTQSGKTSLCKLLTKEFKLTSGQIIIDGQDISSITNQSLGILYMPAHPTFFENRSVLYNVTYPLRVRKFTKEQQLKRFEEIAVLTQLTNVKAKVKKLTLAERKRVALARGLTVKRKAVLLDDFCNSAKQLDELVALFDGSTIVILTSDISLARGNVVVLDGGETVYQGNADGALNVYNKLNWIVNAFRSE